MGTQTTGSLSGPLKVLDALRRGIERVSEVAGMVAAWLVLVIFGVGILNVILRYAGRETGRTLVSNLWVDTQWQLFALLFLVGFPYGIKHQLNPRVDFWFARYSARTKAWLDLVLHVMLFIPFLWMGLRVLWPFVATALGRRFDGSWPTWRLWEVWERSSNPNGLPLGPIKAMMLVGFALLLMQVFAECVKALFVVLGRGDVAAPEEHVGPLPVE